jgi:2-hydroxy-3-keto-5-methylthiopentenyl-1-phosphate phosphatase
MALVRAAPRELDRLLAAVELDTGLGALLETCARADIPVSIISDGFDYCIRRILRAGEPRAVKLLRGTRVCASHLVHAGGGRWRAEFPFFRAACAHGCATCKPAVMEMLNPREATTIFAGDGLSDAYAAREADFVFAKKSLARLCGERAIDFISYDTLADVAARLEEIVRDTSQLIRSGEGTRVRA